MHMRVFTFQNASTAAVSELRCRKVERQTLLAASTDYPLQHRLFSNGWCDICVPSLFYVNVCGSHPCLQRPFFVRNLSFLFSCLFLPFTHRDCAHPTRVSNLLIGDMPAACMPLNKNMFAARSPVSFFSLRRSHQRDICARQHDGRTAVASLVHMFMRVDVGEEMVCTSTKPTLMAASEKASCAHFQVFFCYEKSTCCKWICCRCDDAPAQLNVCHPPAPNGANCRS